MRNLQKSFLFIFVGGMACLFVPTVSASSRSAPVQPGEIFIAAGDSANDGMFAYGWGRVEGRPGTRIRWINKLEADVYVDIEQPGEMDFWLRGTPVFRLGVRQVVGVYVNLDYVSRWVLPYTIGANTYHTVLPAKVFRPGRNRITLRLGYIMRPGNDPRELGMEVESLRLRSR